MKLIIKGEEETEPITTIYLEQVDGQIYLMAEDTDGEPWYLGEIALGGIRLTEDASPDLGFALDKKGSIKVLK
jgi:hypothetical protein